MRTILILFFAIAGGFWGSGQSVPRSGEIKGTVIDEHGREVANAEGCALALGVERGALIPCGLTDSQGRFEIHYLLFADYRGFAKKEDEGYPGKSWDFYGDDGTQKLTLSAEHPSAEIHL